MVLIYFHYLLFITESKQIWAKNIEKASIDITKQRFPNIYRLGDIPKREALKGNQINIFYHAIGIIEK